MPNTSSLLERVIQRDESGRPLRSQFTSGDRVVVAATWHAGEVAFLRSQRWQLSLDGERVLYAEPFVAGLLHGWAKQYSSSGHLLMECPFVRGTGTDFWCTDNGALSEEHPLVGGKPSGVERWWGGARAVYEETHWLDGEWHGPRRHWRDGRLELRCFIRGEARASAST